jgi:hypothetical protein
VCLIGEEVSENKKSLAEISREIAELVVKRANADKHYGVVLLPEVIH